MRTLFTICLLWLAAAAAAQDHPLYVVNGEVLEGVPDIEPDQIERIEVLTASEETIAAYGPKAGNGVLLVTLLYDRPALFQRPDSLTFTEYIARQVVWKENDPTARVVLRYTVEEDGRTTVAEELEATDKRLLRRIRKAVAEAPAWEPALKNGRPVRSMGVLRLQLPAGRAMPRERYIVIR